MHVIREIIFQYANVIKIAFSLQNAIKHAIII